MSLTVLLRRIRIGSPGEAEHMPSSLKNDEDAINGPDLSVWTKNMTEESGLIIDHNVVE